MSDRDYPETELLDFVMCTCEIKCDVCGEEDSMQADEEEAMTEWYYQGWRGRSKCYCPKCAKKKLKS